MLGVTNYYFTFGYLQKPAIGISKKQADRTVGLLSLQVSVKTASSYFLLFIQKFAHSAVTLRKAPSDNKGAFVILDMRAFMRQCERLPKSE